MIARGERDADQRAVWNDVERFVTSTGVSSVAGAFSDGERARSARLEERALAIEASGGRVGLVWRSRR